MKLVVQVRLYPDDAQEAALRETLSACNAAANRVAEVMQADQPRSAFDLHHLTYHRFRTEYGLAAQPMVRVIKKVVRRSQDACDPHQDRKARQGALKDAPAGR